MLDNQQAANQNIPQASAPDLLKKAVLYYLGATLALVPIHYIAMHTSLWVLFIGYLILGVVLNRAILKNLEWHPVYNTLGNVAKAKLFSILLWPLSYLILIGSMVINRYL